MSTILEQLARPPPALPAWCLPHFDRRGDFIAGGWSHSFDRASLLWYCRRLPFPPARFASKWRAVRARLSEVAHLGWNREFTEDEDGTDLELGQDRPVSLRDVTDDVIASRDDFGLWAEVSRRGSVGIPGVVKRCPRFHHFLYTAGSFELLKMEGVDPDLYLHLFGQLFDEDEQAAREAFWRRWVYHSIGDPIVGRLARAWPSLLTRLHWTCGKDTPLEGDNLAFWTALVREDGTRLQYLFPERLRSDELCRLANAN